MNNIIEPLHWRYAVKKYDSSAKLRNEEVLQLKEAVRLAPSSHGLQPYHVLVITDEAIRQKLRAASYNQSQVTDASHLFVFAIQKSIAQSHVDEYFEQVCRIRNVKMEEGLLMHRNSVAGSVSRMTPEQKVLWSSNQAYIALGFLLYAAAQSGIDANPMEGFIPAQYDEILGLKEKGLTAVVIAAAGYRHSADTFQHFTKVRKPASELFENF